MQTLLPPRRSFGMRIIRRAARLRTQPAPPGEHSVALVQRNLRPRRALAGLEPRQRARRPLGLGPRHLLSAPRSLRLARPQGRLRCLGRRSQRLRALGQRQRPRPRALAASAAPRRHQVWLSVPGKASLSSAVSRSHFRSYLSSLLDGGAHMEHIFIPIVNQYREGKSEKGHFNVANA
jgi:hypothetical protein